MTYVINENFSDPRGRWNESAPWDGTEASNSAKGFLSTQEHVDLRNFRPVATVIEMPQSDLEALQQSVLDGIDQSAMESTPDDLYEDEAWTLSATTGTHSDLTYGPLAEYGGWSAARLHANGSAIACTLDSLMVSSYDISHEDFVSVVLPGSISWDNASYIQLSSGADFSGGHVSPPVTFDLNTSTLPEARFPISEFVAAGFDMTKVTGVRVHLVKGTAPANNTPITVMAVRAVKSTWAVSALDFDTRIEAVVVPVTLNATTYGGSTAVNFEFVRGAGDENDPIPADLAVNTYFYGGGAAGNDATGSTYNKISTILREVKNIGAGTGSHIEVTLFFNDSLTKFEVKRVDTTGGSPGTPTVHGLYDTNIGGALDPTSLYLFRTEVKGTQIFASLYKSNSNRDFGDFVWSLPITLTDINYVYRNGRVGFIADLVTKDAYVDEFAVATTGYASLITEVFETRSPVDGAQFAAQFAEDANLWTSFTGTDVLIDQTKSLSGDGSFRTALGVTTNAFIVDDWTQTYFDVALWVPSTVTFDNQPIMLLNTPTGVESIVMPTLRAAQWNRLHFDLGLFRNLLTGIAYSISILPAPSPDRPLGNFWIDQQTVGRRRIAWSVRATSGGPWRQFYGLTNDANGAVHFPITERGRELQVKAEALTADAWISKNFRLFPHYAQLGLPVYDQGFEKR